MNSQTIIEILNRLLETELMALEYYRIHAEAIPEEEIAEGIRGILPAEENHAITLARRIRELGGHPIESGGAATTRGKEMGEESRGQGTLGMLKLEMEREQQAVKDCCIPVADIIDDMVTLEMLEEQLFDEMRHAKWLKQRILKLEESK